MFCSSRVEQNIEELPWPGGMGRDVGAPTVRGRRRRAAPTPVRSLVERAVVGADRVDLLRRGGGRIELEVQPDLHELLRELEADHTLAHAQHLRVVREHRTL